GWWLGRCSRTRPARVRGTLPPDSAQSTKSRTLPEAVKGSRPRIHPTLCDANRGSRCFVQSCYSARTPRVACVRGTVFRTHCQHEPKAAERQVVSSAGRAGVVL